MIFDPQLNRRGWNVSARCQLVINWLINWLTAVCFVCSVSASCGERQHSAADLCHSVPVLPAWGRTVLQLLPLPETGHTRTHAHIRTHTGLTNVVVISLMSCVGLLIIRRCHWKNGLFCVSGDRVFSCSHRCLHRHGGNPLYSRSGTQTTIWRHLGGFVKQLLLTVNDLRVRNKTCSADKEWATVDCRDFLLLITTKKVSTFHHCLIKILFN